MKFTARQRLETYASLSRTQSDEETYDLDHTVVGSVDAVASSSNRVQRGTCNRTVVSVDVGNRETGDMEIRVEPFGYLVQTTTDKNPPHGWAVYMFSGKDVEGSIPFYLAEAVEYMRKECERAWREVDFISKERTEHLEWRTKLANDLDECERMRDVLASTVNTLKEKGDMLAAVVQGAKEEFVRVPYGASHEDVAAIDDWHRMADEALKEWK